MIHVDETGAYTALHLQVPAKLAAVHNCLHQQCRHAIWVDKATICHAGSPVKLLNQQITKDAMATCSA